MDEGYALDGPRFSPIHVSHRVCLISARIQCCCLKSLVSYSVPNSDKRTWVGPGALGNGLKGLELAKVGLIAHPMQNFLRNMIGTLFLMSGGLMVCK